MIVSLLMLFTLTLVPCEYQSRVPNIAPPANERSILIDKGAQGKEKISRDVAVHLGRDKDTIIVTVKGTKVKYFQVNTIGSGDIENVHYQGEDRDHNDVFLFEVSDNVKSVKIFLTHCEGGLCTPYVFTVPLPPIPTASHAAFKPVNWLYVVAVLGLVALLVGFLAEKGFLPK